MIMVLLGIGLVTLAYLFLTYGYIDDNEAETMYLVYLALMAGAAGWIAILIGLFPV